MNHTPNALDNQAYHFKDCDINRELKYRGPCNCGLEELINDTVIAEREVTKNKCLCPMCSYHRDIAELRTHGASNGR